MPFYIHADVIDGECEIEFCVPIPETCPHREVLKQQLHNNELPLVETIKKYLINQINTIETHIHKYQ